MMPAQTRPDLVLLHGWGMSAAVWAPLLPALAPHWRVHALDLPGHGHSVSAVAADLDEWASRCLAAAPEHALWLGWSLGGQVALRAAGLAPSRVDALCLVAATPRFVQSDDWSGAMPRAVFGQFADALALQPQDTLQRFLALQVKGAGHGRETLRTLREASAAAPPPTAAGLRQGLELLLANDLRAGLDALSQPSLWLFGGRDTLVPQAAAAAVAGLLPEARVELISGAGHAPFLSHPADCLAPLRELGRTETA
jgi:pimeloyl-[acyl-carrier protein] methyl ester esterase